MKKTIAASMGVEPNWQHMTMGVLPAMLGFVVGCIVCPFLVGMKRAWEVTEKWL